MAKFYGEVGYAFQEETAPDVWTERVVTRNYRGDTLQMSRRYDSSQNVADNLVVSNRISILADAFAYEHYFAIRYVKWMGARWKVSSVEVQRPRLILSLGGVYNGSEGPTGSETPSDFGI